MLVKEIENNFVVEQYLSQFDEFKKMYHGFLQIILYLLSENAEIVPHPKQADFYETDPAKIQDRFFEVRKWQIGFSLGKQIRKQNTGTSDITNANSYIINGLVKGTTSLEKVPPENQPLHETSKNETRTSWEVQYVEDPDNPGQKKPVLRWKGLNSDEFPV